LSDEVSTTTAARNRLTHFFEGVGAEIVYQTQRMWPLRPYEDMGAASILSPQPFDAPADLLNTLVAAENHPVVPAHHSDFKAPLPIAESCCRMTVTVIDAPIATTSRAPTAHRPLKPLCYTPVARFGGLAVSQSSSRRVYERGSGSTSGNYRGGVWVRSGDPLIRFRVNVVEPPCSAICVDSVEPGIVVATSIAAAQLAHHLEAIL
jgi:hypothetical protein